jgi:hypothetical protein
VYVVAGLLIGVGIGLMLTAWDRSRHRDEI